MEKKYFLQENGKVSQPYSLDDLRNQSITEDTLVCVKYGDWKLAKDIPELDELIGWQPSMPEESNWVSPSPQSQNLINPQNNSNGNKSVIIVAGAILVVAFFMPWITAIVSLNAWDMVFGTVGDVIGSSFRYIAVFIPISGVLIIYGAAFNNGNYPVAKPLLFLVPILTFIVILVVISNKVGSSGGGSVTDLGNLTKAFGIGFWLTLICSIILPFLRQDSSIETSMLDTLIEQDESAEDLILKSNANKVNIGQAPSVSAIVLYQLKIGEEVFFLGEKSSSKSRITINEIKVSHFWYKVQAMENPDIIGWVYGGYLEFPKKFPY